MRLVVASAVATALDVMDPDGGPTKDIDWRNLATDWLLSSERADSPCLWSIWRRMVSLVDAFLWAVTMGGGTLVPIDWETS